MKRQLTTHQNFRVSRDALGRNWSRLSTVGVVIASAAILVTAVSCSPAGESDVQAGSVPAMSKETRTVTQNAVVPGPTQHSPYVPASFKCEKNWEFENGDAVGANKEWEPTNNNVNNEFQHYLDRNCAAGWGNSGGANDWTYCVYDSALHLRAVNTTDGTAFQMGGAVAASHDNGKNGDFKTWGSAKLSTKGNWATQYGYIEVAAKMPTRANNPNLSPMGTWPSVFMFGQNMSEEPNAGNTGWPACGEVDLLEYANGSGAAWGNYNHHQQGNMFWGTSINNILQCDGNDEGRCDANSPTTNFPIGMPALVNEWHVYGLLWEADRIRFYVDGILHGDVNTAGLSTYDQPFFIQANHAVGGNMGGTSTTDLDHTSMSIDYVRVYKWNGADTCGLASTPTPGPEPTPNPPTQAGELLINGGFGSNMNFWIVEKAGTSTIVHEETAGTDGAIDFRLNTAQSQFDYQDRIYQVVQIAEGQKYDFLTQLHKSSAGTRNVNMVIEENGVDLNADGSPYTRFYVGAQTITNTWTEYGIFDWLAPETGAVRVGIYAGGNDLDFEVDSVSFAAIAPANLFTNPNFDANITGWTAYTQFPTEDRVAFVAPGADGMDGSARFYSDGVVNPDYAMQLYQAFPAVAGDKFTLSFDVATTSNTARDVLVYIQQNGPQTGGTAGGDWTAFGTLSCAVPAVGVAHCELAAITVTETLSSVKFGIQGADNTWDFTVDNAALTRMN